MSVITAQITLLTVWLCKMKIVHHVVLTIVI